MIRTTLIAMILAFGIAHQAFAEQAQVDINTASAEQIAEALNGVGPSKSEAIVAYRKEHGAFEHIDELVNVRGIGLRTVDQNRDLIVIEDARPMPDEG
jgi:competence protein ComEA